MSEDARKALPGDFMMRCQAAVSALRSYQYGNTAPDLAKEIADALEAALRLSAAPPEPSAEDTVTVKAAHDADWQQVAFNGGPPCFHIEGEHFCFRTEAWPGHGTEEFHEYVSLASLLRSPREPREVARCTSPKRPSGLHQWGSMAGNDRVICVHCNLEAAVVPLPERGEQEPDHAMLADDAYHRGVSHGIEVERQRRAESEP